MSKKYGTSKGTLQSHRHVLSTCKPIVEKQLKGDRAINKIDIDFMTDSVIVEYDIKPNNKKENKRKA